ncbi:MAG: HAD family hydrolase [Sulfurimonas sp.]|nr:HAD family hydrolase [Sulfurimonas sp.]MDQ7059861.1 HAD family hydrolase [Sulfurimonas sp.]
MNVKVIVFDLDDTLYNEIDYVKSAFMEVSKYFSDTYRFEKNKFFTLMMEKLNQNGRGKVFDDTLAHFNILNKANVKKSISIYRTHIPNIKLPQASKDIINYYTRLAIPLYIVTDGNKLVQFNKIKGLNIENSFKKILITHRYGIKNAKPSVYCFIKIAQLEKVNYSDIVYIGDNIKKDFIAIKKLGFRTIRIKNGMYRNLVLNKEYHAEIDIQSLQDIQNIITIKE